MRLAAACLAAAVLMAGCGATSARRSVTIPATLLAEMRPIGKGVRFHPPVTGRPTHCGRRIGSARAHIELFAANRVALIAAGVGRRAGCEGDVVTKDPTGVVYFRPGATLTDLFAAWGQTLSAHQLLSFTGAVREYVNGRRVPLSPALIPNANIVLEVGPYVPPHPHFTFS